MPGAYDIDGINNPDDLLDTLLVPSRMNRHHNSCTCTGTYILSGPGGTAPPEAGATTEQKATCHDSDHNNICLSVYDEHSRIRGDIARRVAVFSLTRCTLGHLIQTLKEI